MDNVGKISRDILERHILDRLGSEREDVTLGPRHGADFGVISIDDRVLAVATDPLFVPLELGIDRAAWYGFHVGIADVVLSGLPPSHLAVTLTLPPAADHEVLGQVWDVFDSEAARLDAAFLTGHTGRYEGCDWPYVGAMTGLALGEPSDLVRPTGGSPGDALVVTKGPAIETVGVLAIRYGDRLDVSDAELTLARERFEDISPVPDALTAASTGAVTAMHDATERGVDNALLELAAASNVRIDVERARFPMGGGVESVCRSLGIDPWCASSEGTVLMSVRPDGVEDVRTALHRAGIEAAHVGSLREGQGVTVDGSDLSVPDTDPFWTAYTDLADAE